MSGCWPSVSHRISRKRFKIQLFHGVISRTMSSIISESVELIDSACLQVDPFYETRCAHINCRYMFPAL